MANENNVNIKKEFDEKGNLIEESHYQNGILHGMCHLWYQNGNKKLVTSYKMGLCDGSYFSWWENGVKKEEGYFRNGKRIKKYIWYSETGEIINQHEYGEN